MLDYIGTKLLQLGLIIILILASPILIYAIIKEEVDFRKERRWSKMGVIQLIIIVVLLFMFINIKIDSGNPCSNFSKHPGLCSSDIGGIGYAK